MADLVAYPMNGGHGLYSYSKNSTFQRKAIDAGKELIKEAISEKLDIKSFSSSNTFRVTDLGCSVGPNTFHAVQNIVDAVEQKFPNGINKALILKGRGSIHPKDKIIEMADLVAYPMNGGDGLYSYSKNSNFQRKAIDAGNELIKEAVSEKLDIKSFSSSNTFRVTDLGCSVGPNTFHAVQNIVDAVEQKYQSQGHNSQLPEFQVFFSDHTSNDFNALFQSLPPDRRYYATGVPGSFYSRLFPKAFIHFAYSSYALQFLSKVPEEVVDMNSPAWNKGRINYSKSADQVVKAYTTQYAKDMECFLNARAQEIVCGGLMAFVVPGRPNGIPHPEVYFNTATELFGSCLMDMAKKGIISEEKVDCFNLPQYFASLEEVEAIVKANGYFSVEIMENLTQEKPPPKVIAFSVRSGMEGMILKHFGDEIMDELFDSFGKKLEESSSVLESKKSISLFVLLKRRATE